jgi:transcriptional regulator with XRE-family HTH domain
MPNFGQRLLLARRQREVTQGELAKAVGVNINTISRAERGTEAVLSGEVIGKIARTLTVSTDYLLGLRDDFGTVDVLP